MDATASFENQKCVAASTGHCLRYNGKPAVLNVETGNTDEKQYVNVNDALDTHFGDNGQHDSARGMNSGDSNNGQPPIDDSGQKFLDDSGQCARGSDGQPFHDAPGQNSEQQGTRSGMALDGGHPRSSVTPPTNRKSFASLFKDNRVPSEASKLQYIAPPLGKLVLATEEIDSVESAFGYCLVGYVMGPRPSPYALLKFVSGWDKNIKFTFKDNGWIRFQFPSDEVRDRVLNGGPYMIFGRQLFLKNMPSCFLFSKEDMELIPSWVQIFGLPADCWTTQALSRIASVVGKPLHTDALTISKKGATYARILVELDVKKPRVWEYPIVLPTGKEILIKFKYEFDPKFCDICGWLGHNSEMCGIPRGRARRRQQNLKDHSQANVPVDIHSEGKTGVKDADLDGLIGDSSGTKSGKDKGVDSDHSSQLHTHLEDAYLPNPEEALPDVGLDGDGIGDEDKTSVEGSEMHSSHLEDCDMDNDDLLDYLTHIATQDQEEWKTVKGRNKNKKHKGKNNERYIGNSGYNHDLGKFFETMENTSSSGKDTLHRGNHERVSGKVKMNEGRPPDTASGCP